MGAPRLAAALRKALTKCDGGACVPTSSGRLPCSASRVRLGKPLMTTMCGRDPEGKPRPCGAIGTRWADADGAKARAAAGMSKRELDMIRRRWKADGAFAGLEWILQKASSQERGASKDSPKEEN